MRLTVCLQKQNIGFHFKGRWRQYGLRKVTDLGTVKALERLKIPVVNAKEEYETGVMFNAKQPVKIDKWAGTTKPLRPYKSIQVRMPYCHILQPDTNLPDEIRQVQHLTNTLAFSHLPSHMVDNLQETSFEEDEAVKAILLQSHLLDSYTTPYPLSVHPTKFGERKLKKPHTILEPRKIMLSNNGLLMMLDAQVGERTQDRVVINETPCRVTVAHSDREVHIVNESFNMLLDNKPLAPILDHSEVQKYDEQLLPDIYPMSPFLSLMLARPEEEVNNFFCLDYSDTNLGLSPHTLYLVHNDMCHTFMEKDDSFDGKALLYAFSMAVSFANILFPGTTGNLPNPVTVQVINRDANSMTPGVFQLNTLDLTGERKNLFWYHPRITLYDKLATTAAKPYITAYNPYAYQIFKAFHSSGVDKREDLEQYSSVDA